MPRVGVLCDPDFPEYVAKRLAESVPGRLGEQLGDDREWSLEVVCDPVAAGRSNAQEILQAARDQRQRNDWDYAVCLTDLPLRFEGSPVLADIGVDEGIGVVSLPALGGVQPLRRAQQMVVQVLDEILGATEQSQQRPYTQRRRGLHSTLTELLAPIRRENPDRDEIGIRYRATRKRGRVRLLSGMVRSNSPWRLVLGMSSALAAALATSAFGLSSSTIWQISYQLDVGRQIVAALASIALLVFWLITAHQLWEKPHQAHDRELRVLYNTSTVLTLALGVGCLYAALFAINFVVAYFLVPSSLLASSVQSSAITIGTYATLAWGFTTMGVVAGALGSSLESDQAVRQAAYGYRESQRRAAHQEADE